MTGAMVEAKSDHKSAECYDKRDLEAARERRWKSVRHGGGRGGDREAEESEDGAGSDGS